MGAPAELAQTAEAAQCPFSQGNAVPDDRLTASASGFGGGSAITYDADGAWRIRDFNLARQVLRSGGTEQAGFAADLMSRMPAKMRRPVIFQEGQLHRDMRRGTARYFAPKAVADNYHEMMSARADEEIEKLKRNGRADVDMMGLDMAMAITAEIVGLTNHRLPGMAGRLARILSEPKIPAGPWRWPLMLAHSRWCALTFYFLDVAPSVNARKKQPKEDVISHLLTLGYGGPEMLMEATTYGAAGMSTTREFMSIAALHMMQKPELKARFLAGDDEEKRVILQEILRLEPVVTQLGRKVMVEMKLELDGKTITVPVGTTLRLDVRGANHDEIAAGECPRSLDPDREITAPNITRALLSFSDGNHRCPGAYVALQESAIFLGKLLAVPGLRIEKMPKITHNSRVGYELRGFTVTTRPA